MRVLLRRQPGGAMVLRVAGEIDREAAHGLRECVIEQLCLLYNPLVVDLTAVQSLDTAGVAALVRAARDAHQAGALLHVVAHHGVLDPLRNAEVAAVLKVFPTVAAALTVDSSAAPSRPPIQRVRRRGGARVADTAGADTAGAGPADAEPSDRRPLTPGGARRSHRDGCGRFTPGGCCGGEDEPVG